MGSGLGNIYNSHIYDYKDALNSTSEGNTLRESGKAISLSSIEENAKPLIEKYGIDESGKFGKASRYCQVIYTENHIEESKAFFEQISKGGCIEPLRNNPNGVRAVLDDGSRIVYRVITSTKDSPAVDIHISGSEKIAEQKIHFRGIEKND